jgi:hypothetical protein
LRRFFKTYISRLTFPAVSKPPLICTVFPAASRPPQKRQLTLFFPPLVSGGYKPPQNIKNRRKTFFIFKSVRFFSGGILPPQMSKNRRKSLRGPKAAGKFGH